MLFEKTVYEDRQSRRACSRHARCLHHLLFRDSTWALSGPLFGFSDTWQLIVNTGTTIVTFLMVFLIQNTQNRDGAAIQVKLDELIRTGKAHNRFIGIEHLTESEVEEFRRKCEAAAKKHGARQRTARKRAGHAGVAGG